MDASTAIAVALIAGTFGIGGAMVGARIAARATLQAAKQAQDEARLARFADRIREVGASVLNSANRFTEAVNEGMASARLGSDVPNQIAELRLIVRHEATATILDELLSALMLLDSMQPGGEFSEDTSMRSSQVVASRERQNVLETQLRAELELAPAPRAWDGW